jgi:hypothetical protein
MVKPMLWVNKGAGLAFDSYSQRACLREIPNTIPEGEFPGESINQQSLSFQEKVWISCQYLEFPKN